MTQVTRSKNSQAGMTLVELMIAMVIASIVIVFLFSIQTRMSRAYHGQSTVAEINQNLQAAKQMLVGEIRMAGYGLGAAGLLGTSPAVKVALGSPDPVRGFLVENDVYADGNDSFRVIYGVPTGEAMVDTLDIGGTVLTLSGAAPIYAANEPVILSSQTASCLVAITSVAAGPPAVLQLGAAGVPYNNGANAHCVDIKTALINAEVVTIQRFVMRSYQIDPNREESGFLQQKHGVGGIWVDLGVGFTNMQLAQRFYEEGDGNDRDNLPTPGADAERDWYSSDNQVEGHASRPANAVLIQASLSIEARSPHGTRGAAASTTTPAFTDLGNVDHNPIGDWGVACTGANTDPCGIHLSATPDASRPNRYKGEFIYRYSRSIIDLRNMGVGR